MADWQERVQSMIMGFVFAYMVMKLFSVIANFRAGNMRVERAAEVETETETETEAETEAEPREESSSSSSSDDDEEEEKEKEKEKDAVVEEVQAAEEPKKDTESKEEIGGGAFEEEEEDDEDWEGVESTELEKRFAAASTFADNPEATPEMHALYKLATEGPCSSSQPSAFQPAARAKWNAWQKLGTMSQEEAMHKYIDLVTAIHPSWREAGDVSPSKEGGLASST